VDRKYAFETLRRAFNDKNMKDRDKLISNISIDLVEDLLNQLERIAVALEASAPPV